MARSNYELGCSEVGDGVLAYLQPDGGWGFSNAGLVSDGEATLLVDTLFDLKLTEAMLADMRRAVPAAERIGTIVNTHANGDHCYGNALIPGARVIASEHTAAEMAELPPAAMAALIEQAPQMGALGEFFLRCFGSFEFAGIEAPSAGETFSGELELEVGSRSVQLIEAGPAHTRGDTMAWLQDAGVLFTGDILFNGAHPIAWAGPLSSWIAACDRIESLAPTTIVPGHGPLATLADVREARDYFLYLDEQARRAHEDGLSAQQAAQRLKLDRWADWGEGERLVVNIANVYAEIEGGEPPNPLEGFQQMAELRAHLDAQG